MNENEIRTLAGKHGLHGLEEINFNQIGLDFQVAFAKDQDGVNWVLRIPRRTDMLAQIQHESKILALMKQRLQLSVPDWKHVSSEFVAYPLLKNAPAIAVDERTHQVIWKVDPKSKKFISSLAAMLVELHKTPTEAAIAAGLSHLSPEQVRAAIAEDLERVKIELGISAQKERQLQAWINNESLWPPFSVLVHGDLYAGHILVGKDELITGVIDWSEAKVSDPSLDFAGHLTVFGEESLRDLIYEYQNRGGATWPALFDHTKERASASFLSFAIFALNSKHEGYINAAKSQLLE
ncbi:MAG: macrolide 2'-phosphotransferase [Bdellovibrionaceae bacterium]|nr:macrolide 2'-phosphotransferase [Pseudobdellovibrionaceae bacterium]